jgi:hypothetical protein
LSFALVVSRSGRLASRLTPAELLAAALIGAFTTLRGTSAIAAVRSDDVEKPLRTGELATRVGGLANRDGVADRAARITERPPPLLKFLIPLTPAVGEACVTSASFSVGSTSSAATADRTLVDFSAARSICGSAAPAVAAATKRPRDDANVTIRMTTAPGKKRRSNHR